MKRLTTETPDGNFETILNFVFSKDGWAHIRYDGSEGTVPLTQWAKAQCILHGCGEFSAEMPQEIDEEISDCLMMDFPDCPVALAYGFAVQACHLRDRLKMYEDICFADDRRERLPLDVLRDLAERTVPSPLNAPLTLEELREMDGEPVWVVPLNDFEILPANYLVNAYAEQIVVDKFGAYLDFEDYGKTWLSYRRKPEEVTHGNSN